MTINYLSRKEGLPDLDLEFRGFLHSCVPSLVLFGARQITERPYHAWLAKFVVVGILPS